MTNDIQASLAHISDELWQRQNEAVMTRELLDGYRTQVESEASSLENPQAVLEYIDFFAGLAARSADDCQDAAADLARGVSREQVDVLRRIVEVDGAQQRRCLAFRDTWINKPLPHERMRPLLNDISVATRDLLATCRDLQETVDRLERLLVPPTPPSPEQRTFDRRALFTRLFKP